MTDTDREILKLCGWKITYRKRRGDPTSERWVSPKHTIYSVGFEPDITTDMLIEAACKLGEILWRCHNLADGSQRHVVTCDGLTVSGKIFREALYSAIEAAIAAKSRRSTSPNSRASHDQT